MINPLGALSWLAGVGQAIASWYTDSVKQTINFLLMNSVPSPDEIKSSFFSLALGGTYGLSTLIVGGVAVVIGTMIILRPQENHSRNIGKILNSVLWLVIFALLFYRGYGLLYGFFQGAGQGAVNLLTGTQNGSIAQLNSILLVVTPSGVGAILLLGPFSVLFILLALAEAFAFHVVLFLLLIVYPLLIALRPLPVFNTLFHAANSAVVVILISPLLMTWAIALPVVVSNIIPGATATGIPVVLTLVGSALAFAAPIVIAIFVFNTSRKVFGAVDSTVSGLVSIGSMPPVDMNEMRRDINNVHTSPLKAIATDVIGDEILNGDMFRDMRKVALNAAATGFAAAGHPYVSVAIKAVPTVAKNVKERFSATETEPLKAGESGT